MHWIAPSEKDTAAETLEKQLWDSANHFRANSDLKAQEYSGPILRTFFLRFAEGCIYKSKTSAGCATCCCRVCCRGT